jgi:hypothetical protein
MPHDREPRSDGIRLPVWEAWAAIAGGAVLQLLLSLVQAGLFCGRFCTRPTRQTLGVAALREVKRLHQGRAEIPLYKLMLDAATQEIASSVAKA